MEKAEQVRQLLEKHNEILRNDPSKLNIFIEDGNIIATSAKSTSFEYSYNLNIIILDYAEPVDFLMVPIVAWMFVHQNEKMANPDLRQDAIKFEVELNNNKSYDIGITLSLTERVIVKQGEKGLEYKHVTDTLPQDMAADWAIDLVGTI